MKKAIYNKGKVMYVEMSEEEIKQIKEQEVIAEPVISQDEINCDLDFRLSLIELGLV